MQPIDKSVRFVEFVTQTGHSATGNQRCVTLHTPGATFGGFDLLRDLVDVSV
jgi:hypothetical protein